MKRSTRTRLGYAGAIAVLAAGGVGGWSVAGATGETNQQMQDLVTNGLAPLQTGLDRLGDLEELARSVPLLDLPSAGPDGLSLHDALAQALHDGSDDLLAATDLNDLASRLDGRDTTVAGVRVRLGCAGFGGGCTHHVTVDPSSTTTGGGLTIPITLSRDVSAPLLSSLLGTGAVTGAAAGTLTFTTTPTLTFDYAKLAGADPTGLAVASPLTGTLTAALTPGSSSFTTSLGFTQLTGALSVSSAQLDLALTMTDPDGAGGTDLGELATTDVHDLVDVVPSGTVDATATLDTSLTPTSPDVTLTWSDASLATTSAPTPSVSSGALDVFRNATPEGVFNGIAQLGNALQAFQANGDLRLPFLSDGLASLSNFTAPVFDFIAQNSVACSSSPTSTPDGNTFTLGMLIYCSATAVGPIEPGSVQWGATGATPAATDNHTTDDDTVGPVVVGPDGSSGPSARAVFVVTDPSTLDVHVDYQLHHDVGSPTDVEAHQAPRTAQQLAQRLADAGLGASAADIMAYDPATRALTFHLRKTIASIPSQPVGFGVGDQMQSIGLSGGATDPHAPVSAAAHIDFSATDVVLDVTFGVLLTPSVDDINPTATYPTSQPRGETDRFFVQTPADGPVASIDSVSLTGAAAVQARIGFLGVQVATPATTQFLTKAAGSDPMLAVDVALPGFDVVDSNGATATIADAVQLRNLGTVDLVPDFANPDNSAVRPHANAAFHLPLALSATVGGHPLTGTDGTTTSTGVDVDVDGTEVFTDPAAAVHVTLPDQAAFDSLFAGLANTDNPTAMLGLFTGLLDQLMQQFSSSAAVQLNAPLPVIGKSPRQLLGQLDCLRAAIETISGNPASPATTECPDLSAADLPATLQDFLHTVETQLGLPSDTLQAELVPAVQVGGTDHRSLVLHLQLSGAPSGNLPPLALDLGSDGSLATTSAQADVALGGSYTIDLNPGVTLDETTPTPFLTSDSHIDLGVTASSDDMGFNASIGPLDVAFGSLAQVSSGSPTGQLHVDAHLTIGYAGPSATTAVGDLAAVQVSDPTGSADCDDINYGSDSSTNHPLSGLACLNVSASLGSDPLGGFGFAVTGLDPPASDYVIPPDLADRIQNALLDPTVLLQAFSRLVQQLSSALHGAGGNIKVPVVGDALDAGAGIADTLRTQVVDPINTAIQSVPHSNAGELRNGLQNAVATSLTSAGLLRKDDTADAGDSSDVTVTVKCGGSTDCTDDQGLTEVTDVRVTALVGQGAMGDAGCAKLSTAAGCATPVQPFDIGLDGLPVHLTGAVQPRVGWRVRLDVGIDRTTGPYIGRTTDSDPLVRVGAGIGLGDSTCDNAADPVDLGPGFPAVLDHYSGTRCLNGRLAFLDVNARDGAGTGEQAPSGVDVDTEVFIDSTSDTINAANVGTAAPAVLVDGSAAVNLRVHTLLGADGTGLPSVVGALHVGVADLSFDSRNPSVQPTLTASFDGLTLDAGSFFSGLLGPIARDVQKVTGPIKPVLDTLQAPLPVLTQLAALVGQPPVTLLSLVQATSGQDLSLVSSLLSLIDFVNHLPTDGTLVIPLDGSTHGASFLIDTTKAKTGGQTPSNADSIIDQGSLSSFASSVLDRVPGAGNTTQRVDVGANPSSDTRTTTFGVKGLEFPFLTNPSSLAGLLVGRDIDLVTFDAGTLRASASTQMDFGPFFIGPVPVTVFIGGGVTVAGRFKVGYDTSGLRAVLNGAPGSALLDGIYLSDWDSAGNDVPEITLVGDVFAGAKVDIVVAAAGVQGGIKLTVDLNLDDSPDQDGKLNFNEVVDRLDNPFCLFTVRGSLDAYLNFFLEINLFLFSEHYDIPILNVHLLDFHSSCSSTEPPVLASLASDGTLTLNMGPHAGDRHVDASAKDENFTVTMVDGTAGHKVVEVKAFGLAQQYGAGVHGADGSDGSVSVSRIVADGRNNTGDAPRDGNDVVKLLPGGTAGTTSTTESDRSQQVPFDVPAQVTTGDGNDQVVTGSAADVIDTGAGNDHVDAGAGDDTVHGGDGADGIDGGPGDDHLFGDAGNDAVHGNGGADLVDGGPDADTIDGGPAPTQVPDGTDSATRAATLDGDNVLVGGGGGDTVVGGPGNDAIVLLDAATYGIDVNGSVSAAHTAVHGLVATSCPASGAPTPDVSGTAFGGPGNDDLLGDNGPDRLVGGGGADRICALAGNDTVLGDDEPGAANPALPSPPGGDYIDAGSGNDQVDAGGGDDEVNGGTGSDVLRGGDGNDRIIGSDGMDVIDAGRGADRVLGDNGTIDAALPATHPETSVHPASLGDIDDGIEPTCAVSSAGFATDPAYGRGDCITGGDGADVLFGQGGNDHISGGAGDDYVDGGHGADLVHGGQGDDTIFGGGEGDTVYADSGDDHVYGQGGDDHLHGQAGNDTIYGNDGVDTITGDGGDDDLVGGSATSGATDTGDVIDGGEGADFIAGDNAVITRPTVALLAGSATDGDTISGGNGDDHVWGEQAGDTIHGNAGDDVLFGNEGVDVISGDDGADHIVGGSADGTAADAGDTIHGNAGDDVVLGDNGTIDPDGTVHLGPTGGTGSYGGDTVYGDAGDDIVHGQEGDDHLYGNAGNDRVYGELGGDVVTGDAGFDYLLGDQGTIAVPAGGPATDVDGAPVYDVTLTDPDAGGVDTMDGGLQDDHMWGGAAGDTMAGGAGDDYIEGNGGNDTIYGFSAAFESMGISDLDLLAAGLGDDDDIIGGSSDVNPAPVKHDTGETLVQGNAGQDVVIGDNGTITRTPLPDHSGWVQDPVMTGAARTVVLYDTDRSPADLAAVSGGDVIEGNSGNDRVWGEGGDDTVNGNDGNDVLVGNQGSDHVHGDAGQDDVVGGSLVAGQPDTGDFLYGGAGQDVVAGDNALVTRTLTGDGTAWALDPVAGFGNARGITLLDTEKTGADLAAVSGNDLVHGDDQDDKLYGEAGNDTVKGGNDADHIEGDQGSDLLEGNAGEDDIIGGSTVAGRTDGDDVIHGGAGADVVTADNGVIDRVPPADAGAGYYYVTYQIGITAKRAVRLLDIGSTDPTVAGTDQVSGGTGVDVLFGQGERDYVMGGGDDDYVEGNNGSDFLFGDRTRTDLVAAPTAQMVAQHATLPALPAGLPEGESSEPDLSGGTQVDGQDDIIGGSSKAGLTDNNDIAGQAASLGDFLYGNGAQDFELGDNGRLVRTIEGGAYTTYVHYDPSTVVRAVTRYDVAGAASTHGDDYMEGNAGDDYMWGQDGDDEMHGGAGNDDMYGELGDDLMYGDAGEDAMVGDRGSITDTLVSDPDAEVSETTQGPAFLSYVGLRVGQLDRRVDLLHDLGGADLPYNGLDYGGDDTMFGGTGHDSMHGGAGDDIMNGDSGGDWLFGDGGSDVLWGGRGSDDPLTPDARQEADTSSPNYAQGITSDNLVDYLFGGSNPEPDSTATQGSDLLDFRPRGAPADCNPDPSTTNGVDDPCSWFAATNTGDDDPTDPTTLANNQHHQGIDWMYGGLGRDVMQGDVGSDQPDQADRGIDWDGNYNLYTRCNASYGGDNDIRQELPDLRVFIEKWAYGSGAGNSLADLTTPGTSGYRELAEVHPSDHNQGSAYPTTPGHFDDFSCAP